MQIFALLPIALSVLPVALGKPEKHTSAGALWKPDDFYHRCADILIGCKFVDRVEEPGVQECNCNDNPDGWDDYIWFYEFANFKGRLYKGFGLKGQCQTLPSIWYASTESVFLNDDPSTLCCLYTQPDCKETGLWEQRDSTSPAGKPGQQVAEFMGIYRKGVRSFRCSPWKVGATCKST